MRVEIERWKWEICYNHVIQRSGDRVAQGFGQVGNRLDGRPDRDFVAHRKIVI
jgi:hypothetical protein